jgi:hypothetical protein
MWLTGGMSGRADRTSNTYTKQSSITGKTIAVTLRNPVGYDKQGAKQIAQQNKFHALTKGIATFCRRISADNASAEDKEIYKSLVSTVRGQHRYGTVRGYLMAKCASVNEELTQVKISYRDHEETINVSFQARGVVTRPNDEPDFSGDDSGSTDSGNSGNTDGGSSVDPNPVNPDPAAGETYSIQAGVGADGGGSVTIKKNGAAVEGGSVEATGSDTVVLQAVPENANFQFMSWSDGNSQNPRTIQPSADMNVTANFLDLSKI